MSHIVLAERYDVLVDFSCIPFIDNVFPLIRGTIHVGWTNSIVSVFQDSTENVSTCVIRGTSFLVVDMSGIDDVRRGSIVHLPNVAA